MRPPVSAAALFLGMRRPRRVPSDRSGGAAAPVLGRRARRLALPLWITLTLATSAVAHPIHRSIAEADYNQATHTLEVALRVYADDFEAALSARTKRKISLEKTPAAEIDALAHRYVEETFTIKTGDDAPTTLHWIGRKLKDAENELWLYFEVPLPGGVEGAKIRHAVLSDQFRDQLNSVLVRDGARKVTLVFLPTHTEKSVRFPP